MILPSVIAAMFTESVIEEINSHFRDWPFGSYGVASL
jgi:hypothetical protein